MIREILIILFLVAGVGFVLLAALGAIRFQDALTRMAAVSKASTLGLSLILVAVVIYAGFTAESLKAFVTILLLWLSSPIAAHLLGRAAILADDKLHPRTKGKEFIGEIKGDL